MDLRIEKTQRSLIAAFTRLLEKYPYENITVAMLCDEAMIRRTTFYKHFADKAAFFAFFVDSLKIDFERRGEQSGTGDAPHSAQAERIAIFQQLIDFLLEHEQMMDNIFASSMIGSMTLVMCSKVAESISERYREECNASGNTDVPLDAAAQFAAGGIMRLLQAWWERGHAAEDEEKFVNASNTLIERVLGIVG